MLFPAAARALLGPISGRWVGVVSGSCARHSVVHDVTGDVDELDLGGLALGTQARERILGGAPCAAPDDAEGLVDLGAAGECCGELCDQTFRLGEHLGVRHAHSGRPGERLAELDGVLVERLSVACVDVEGPEGPVAGQERERQRAVGSRLRCSVSRPTRSFRLAVSSSSSSCIPLQPRPAAGPASGAESRISLRGSCCNACRGPAPVVALLWAAVETPAGWNLGAA